jgi:hypothetical protein
MSTPVLDHRADKLAVRVNPILMQSCKLSITALVTLSHLLVRGYCAARARRPVSGAARAERAGGLRPARQGRLSRPHVLLTRGNDHCGPFLAYSGRPRIPVIPAYGPRQRV